MELELDKFIWDGGEVRASAVYFKYARLEINLFSLKVEMNQTIGALLVQITVGLGCIY